MDLATNKSRTELKQLAKKNDVKSSRILAKEIVRSNKQRDRLVSSKARLNSVQMQLQHQLSMVKVTGAFQKSTEIMKSTNALVKLPQLNATMRQMSMEMMKVSRVTPETPSVRVVQQCIDGRVQWGSMGRAWGVLGDKLTTTVRNNGGDDGRDDGWARRRGA